MSLDLATLQTIWRTPRDKILCPKVTVCPTQWRVRNQPIQKICYTTEHPKCYFYPKTPFPPVEEHAPEFPHEGVWGYEIHPERSKSGQSCERCIGLNGKMFSGPFVRLLFPYHEHIDQYSIKAMVHPRYNCELWQLAVIR